MENENPWVKLNKDIKVLDSDIEEINVFNNKNQNDYTIITNIFPEPFIGRINSPIVLLSLNPGFDKQDIENHKEFYFKTVLKNNLEHKPNQYEFYYLDPKLSHTKGSLWWNKKLKPLLEIFDKKIISDKISVIEYFPYHSKSYKKTKHILESQKYSFDLVRMAIKRNAIIIVMRSEKIWLNAVPELKKYNYYKLNSPQNVILSKNNLGESAFNELIDKIKL